MGEIRGKNGGKKAKEDFSRVVCFKCELLSIYSVI
jgi:hypothetical protein